MNAFDASGNGQFNLDTPFILSTLSAWRVAALFQYDGLSTSFIMGGSGGSDPYFGWFNGVASVRIGGTASALSFTPVVGEYYLFEIENDGAGNVTFTCNGESLTYTQTADVTINKFLRYTGSFDNSGKHTGIVKGTWDFFNTSVGDLSYNWDQPIGSTTLIDDLQGHTAQLVGTGEFIELEGGAGDTTAPVITLQGGSTVTVTVGTSYSEPGYTATDDTDGDITANVVVGGDTVDANTIGTYVVTYNVSDAVGNNATQVTRTVNVVAEQSASITITSVVNDQFIKADANNQAQFTIAGDIVDGTGPVEYTLDGGTTWQVLDASTGTSYSGVVTITDEQDVTVRLSSNNAITATVERLAAALIICVGPAQSNGAGRGINYQVPTWTPGRPVPRMWKSTTGFVELADPTGIDSGAAGSFWPWIAKKLSDLGRKVVFGNVAEGGTAIATWIPGAAENYHQRILDFAAAAGGLSICTTVIGESDSQLHTTTADFKTQYMQAVQPLIDAYDCDIYAVYFPTGSSLSGWYTNIYAAYDEIIAENERVLFGGDLSVINIDYGYQPGNDGLHIKQDADLQQAADIWFNAFTGIVSVASITFENAVDGTYDIVYWNAANIDLSAPVEVTTATISGGVLTIPTQLDSGTAIIGLLPGDDAPNTGGAFYGVTA